MGAIDAPGTPGPLGKEVVMSFHRRYRARSMAGRVSAARAVRSGWGITRSIRIGVVPGA